MRRVPFERILSVRLLKHVAGGCAAPVQGEIPVGIAQIVAAERETAGAVARSGAGGADAEGRIAIAAEVIFIGKSPFGLSLYFPPQILEITFFENRIVLQHIYTLEAVDKPLLIVQVRRHGLIEPSAIFPILFRFSSDSHFKNPVLFFSSKFISVFAGTSFSKRRSIGVENRSFRMSLT